MVSVIIPAYNRARTIERSINSVLAQTYKDVEVIVVDDCSTDDTEIVVKGIKDSRIRYEKLAVNSGACVARNRGVEVSKGELIAFQDSDDCWLPNKLQIQLQAIEESGADVCFCALKRHYVENSKPPIVWPDSPNNSSVLDHVTLRRKSIVSTQTIVAKRHVFDSVVFDPKVIKSQDYDWIIRASKKYRVYFVAEALVEQYLQNDSISLSGFEKFVASREYLLSKYSFICREDSQFEYYLLQQIAHYKTLSTGNAREEYKRLYKLKKNSHNLTSLILSRLNLIKLFVK